MTAQKKIDLKKYMDLYPQLEKFKNFVDLTPAELVQFLIEVGKISVNHSKDLIIQDLKKDIEVFLNTKNVDNVLESAKKIMSFFNNIEQLRDKTISRIKSNEVKK